MRTHLLAFLSVLAISMAGFALDQPPAEKDEPQISFETRVVTIPANAPLPNWPAKEGEVAFLTDADLKAALEATQSDRRANVLSAPKVTVESNQEAVVKIVDERRFVTSLEAVSVNGEPVCVPKTTAVELGTTLTLRGRISADKTAVAVEVKYFDKRLEKVDLIPVTAMIAPVFEGGSKGKPVPFTQYLEVPRVSTVSIDQKDLRIASGAHVAIGGPITHQEMRTEVAVPGISKLPVVGRLFRTIGVGRTPVRTILIVSPRVLELED